MQPYQAGEMPSWAHISKAAPPLPALPTWKDKVRQAGMCTQYWASPGLERRRLIFICSLIKAILDYQGLKAPRRGAVIRYLLPEHIRVLEVMPKPQSLGDLSTAGLASSPTSFRELLLALPRPHPIPLSPHLLLVSALALR